MVTRRIAEALLAAAVRRWPAPLREDLHREWTAEVHILAEQDRPWPMLRYAASLAAARPVADRATAPLGRRAWHAARLLVVAPVGCVALFIASLLAMNLALLPVDSFRSDLLSQVAYHAQVPLTTAFCLLSAVLMGRLGKRWALTGSTFALPVVLAVTLPGFAVTSIFMDVRASAHKVAVHAPVYACYFALLTVVLLAVARRIRMGRPRAARWTAVLGAFAAADVAVMIPLLQSETAREEGLTLANAPIWLFTSLTDWGFGLLDQGGMGIFLIGDLLELDAQLLLIFTGLALGAVAATARATSALATAPEAPGLAPES
jgi:hypothetical protein